MESHTVDEKETSQENSVTFQNEKKKTCMNFA